MKELEAARAEVHEIVNRYFDKKVEYIKEDYANYKVVDYIDEALEDVWAWLVVVSEDLIKALLERAYMEGQNDALTEECEPTLAAELIFLQQFKGPGHDFS